MGINWDVAKITNPDFALDHQEAVREIRSEKRHRGEQVRAALYTYRVCYITKEVGTQPGRRSYQHYAHELGYSKSYITGLRRLGRAIVVHGVSPNSDLFSKLRNAAVRKEVGRLLDSDTPQPHDQLSQAIAASETTAAACKPRDLEEVLAEAWGVVDATVGHADVRRLMELEETLADLFFMVRQARRRTQASS